MKAIVDWLSRLRGSDPASLQLHHRPVFVPGFAPLQIDRWLLVAQPKGLLAPRVGDCAPSAASLLGYLDSQTAEQNVNHHETLTGQLSGLMSLAANRRVTMPNVVVLGLPVSKGEPRAVFLGLAGAADHQLLGPLPENTQEEFAKLLELVAGLPTETLEPVGKAIDLHYSSALLFESDLRAAYLLLVAGIEVLSEAFGSTTRTWSEWDQSADWDRTLAAARLTDEQAAAMRDRLLRDRQVGLRARFRDYGSSRAPESFWDQPVEAWIWGCDANAGTFLPAHMSGTRQVREIMPPTTKGALSRRLALSYDARSAYVHRGERPEFMQHGLRHKEAMDDGPIAFPILRLLLRSLILEEVRTRSRGGTLPNIVFQLGPVQG